MPADRGGQRFDGGFDDRCTLDVEDSEKTDAAEPVGRESEAATLLGVSLFAIESVAQTLVGQVRVDMSQDPFAEPAENAGFELSGVPDQDRFDLVHQP